MKSPSTQRKLTVECRVPLPLEESESISTSKLVVSREQDTLKFPALRSRTRRIRCIVSANLDSNNYQGNSLSPARDFVRAWLGGVPVYV